MPIAPPAWKAWQQWRAGSQANMRTTVFPQGCARTRARQTTDMQVSRGGRHLHAVGTPAALLGGLGDVALQRGGQARQVQEVVAGAAQHRHRACQLAARAHQLGGVHQPPALVALVPPRVLYASALSFRLGMKPQQL